MGSSTTMPGGPIAQGIGGALFDPANISGFFGHNKGPGAFMDPSGSGGGLFPGQSLGSSGPIGNLGINADLLGSGGKGGSGGSAASKF